VLPGQSTTISFEVRRCELDALLNQNHANEPLRFELLDASGRLVASSSDKRLRVTDLPSGTYRYRVTGAVSRPIDFTIKSAQGVSGE
jgi:hypothetical protein